MNKEELYNAAIKVYNETGQGLPGALIRRQNADMAASMDELIAEGLFKSIIDPTGPMLIGGDEWVCLTKGYCVEETYGSKGHELAYVRIFKGIPDIMFPMKDEEVLANEQFMAGYQVWLEANRTALEEVIEPLPVPAKS